ncbi:MAG: hypothetical protein LBE76_04130 [Nitrososphaerota archaeon]|jgi:flagellar basal body-associated protein FliL|nr:hypothetical protein [Nitrososphaerota archaeon]
MAQEAYSQQVPKKKFNVRAITLVIVCTVLVVALLVVVFYPFGSGNSLSGRYVAEVDSEFYLEFTSGNKVTLHDKMAGLGYSLSGNYTIVDQTILFTYQHSGSSTTQGYAEQGTLSANKKEIILDGNLKLVKK